MPFHISAFGVSDRGVVRPKNEDAMAVDPSHGIAIVADGMGGAPAGEVASGLAVEEVHQSIRKGLGIREAVERANGKILERASEKEAVTSAVPVVVPETSTADAVPFALVSTGEITVPSVVEKSIRAPEIGFPCWLTSNAVTSVEEIPSAMRLALPTSTLRVRGLKATLTSAARVFP